MTLFIARHRDLIVRWKLLGAFHRVLLCVIAESAFVYRSTFGSQGASDMVEDKLQVIDRINNTTSALMDRTGGYRGSRLTGGEAHFKPYLVGRDTLPFELAGLNELTDEYPEQMARWSDVERRAAVWQRDE